MNGYIYVLDYYKIVNKDKPIKIGSTMFPRNRLHVYQTGMFYDLKYSHLYKIIKSKYNCYEIDDLIKKEFEHKNHYSKYTEGGKEWYQINHFELEKFFNDNDIVFEEVKLNECPSIELENFDEFIDELKKKNIL